jgi:UDP-N-acetylmuramate-alanine ligase
LPVRPGHAQRAQCRCSRGRRPLSRRPAEHIREGLSAFTGVGRRFEVKAVVNGITLIDDYGHHPAEIRATLEAARGCKFKRLLVLFQPHRYTRTQHLWDDFCLRSISADHPWSSPTFTRQAKRPSLASPP